MIEYLASAVNVVSSNPFVGPLLRIKISFFLLSACTKELLPTLNNIACLPNPLPSENEKVTGISNSIPNLE